MVKKILAIVIGILAIGLIGGGIYLMVRNIPANNLENQPNTMQATNSADSSDADTAVIYFSATGNTEQVAELIHNATGGDLIEIVPEKIYSDDDLSYDNDESRASQERNDPKARPKIANEINTDSYDVIYLGYPIWWNEVPKIILTFLDEHNLNGKTVIPFCTSGGSSIKNSMNILEDYNKNINWGDGQKFSPSASQAEVNNWVESVN